LNFGDLKVNTKFHLYGKPQAVVSIDPPKVVYRGLEGTGETVEIDFITLYNNPTFTPETWVKRQIKKEKRNDLFLIDTLQENQREGVSRRLEAIKPLLLIERIKSDEIAAVVEFIKNYKEFLPNEIVEELNSEMLISNELLEKVKKLRRYELVEKISKKHNLSGRTIVRWVTEYENEFKETGIGLPGLLTKPQKGFFRQDDKVI